MSLEQLIITAAQRPKLWEPGMLVLTILLCILGCIIGLELMANTGTTPNTSLVGAPVAIIISRIPISVFMKLRSWNHAKIAAIYFPANFLLKGECYE